MSICRAEPVNLLSRLLALKKQVYFYRNSMQGRGISSEAEAQPARRGGVQLLIDPLTQHSKLSAGNSQQHMVDGVHWRRVAKEPDTCFGWSHGASTRAVPEEIIGIKGGGGGGMPISSERVDCRRREGEWMELHATQAQQVRYYRSGSEMRQARDQKGKK